MNTCCDYARLAAFIDGEGCISIKRKLQKRRKKNGEPIEGFQVEVQITNTDTRLILWCQEKFGGTAFKARKTSTTRKACWVWYCTGKTAVNIMKECLSYFIIKREQAELTIYFSENLVGFSGKRIPNEVSEQRLMVMQKVSALKRISFENLGNPVFIT